MNTGYRCLADAIMAYGLDWPTEPIEYRTYPDGGEAAAVCRWKTTDGTIVRSVVKIGDRWHLDSTYYGQHSE